MPARAGGFVAASVRIGEGVVMEPRTIVIVPTYNERDNLPRLTHELLALDPALDILVVDDNSLGAG